MRLLTSLWLLVAVCACADPAEFHALQAKTATLQREMVQYRKILSNEELYRDALKELPLSGMPLEPAEVSARVTRATAGVAVSVERAPGGGLGVSFSGPAAPARAAVALAQLAPYLPDLSLSQVSLGAGGFSARGTVDPQGPRAESPIDRGGLIPITQLRKERQHMAEWEEAVRKARAKLGEDLAERGPAALAAARSPDRLRQQAAVIQALVAGASPLAATAEVSFQPSLITARGTLAPGRRAVDAVPLLKPDYELQSLSENGGRFELKLSPRATAR